MAPEPSTRERRIPLQAWLYLVGYLASIILALWTWLVGLPRLLARTPHLALGLAGAVLLVPGVPAVSTVLQGEAPPRLGLVLLLYIEQLADLLFQLLALALVMPLVLINLIAVLGGLFLAALSIGGLMYAAQQLTGADLGIAIGPAEMAQYLRILLPGLAGEGLLIAFMLWLNPRSDRIMAWFGHQRYAMSQRIKRHYPKVKPQRGQ